MAISDEVKTKLEDIARHLNISKEEVISRRWGIEI
jgi:predicted transcriptional regulator